jgi:hypothetical protein
LTRRVSGPNPDLIPPRCLRQHQAYAGCLGPCNGAGRAVLADQQLAPHTREHRTSESLWRLRLPLDRPLCQPHRSLRLVLRCDGLGTTARIATARSRHHDGGLRILPVHRWLGARGAGDAFDDVVVAMCSGPKIELGCSPECLVVHLIQRGVPVLSFDRSVTAIRLAGRCGAPALLGDLFQPSPASGRCPKPGMGCWQTVLLVDGNVGLGGDPRPIWPGVHHTKMGGRHRLRGRLRCRPGCGPFFTTSTGPICWICRRRQPGTRYSATSWPLSNRRPLWLLPTAAMFGRSVVAYLVWAVAASRRSGRVCSSTEDPRGTLPE